jgi:hypothetical protein
LKRSLFKRTIDDLVKIQKYSILVFPVKAGIQANQESPGQQNWTYNR